MSYTSTRVARRILEIATKNSRPVTPLELIKLTYLAHGWSLGLRGQPLVHDKAEAWQYGPVFPELYHAIKVFKASPVTSVPAHFDEGLDPEISDEDSRFIESVYNAYKAFNGVQLSSLTHQDETPWAQAWSRLGRNNEIKNENIRDHYQRLASERKP